MGTLACPLLKRKRFLKEETLSFGDPKSFEGDIVQQLESILTMLKSCPATVAPARHHSLSWKAQSYRNILRRYFLLQATIKSRILQRYKRNPLVFQIIPSDPTSEASRRALTV